MTKNILIGLNLAYGTKFHSDCEVLAEALEVGDIYKGEEVLEVIDFNQPKTEEPTYTCQMVTTEHYHEIVVINPLD